MLHFASHTLQEIALGIMATVYTIRLIWFFSFKAGGDRQPQTGPADTTRAKGAAYSLINIMMPWAMESTRKKFPLYLQFVVFHLGVTAAILLSFVIPYLPGLLTPAVVLALQIIIGAAFLVGLMRIVRRVSSPVMRAISSPDDYFSLILLTAWFAFAVLAAPNKNETFLLIYFFTTAFFLVYVPFSKISHYLYYPFTRFWLGRSLGHRGVYPIRRGTNPVSH